MKRHGVAVRMPRVSTKVQAKGRTMDHGRSDPELAASVAAAVVVVVVMVVGRQDPRTGY